MRRIDKELESRQQAIIEASHAVVRLEAQAAQARARRDDLMFDRDSMLRTARRGTLDAFLPPLNIKLEDMDVVPVLVLDEQRSVA